MAQGINMLAFLPAALVALFIHRKEGRLAAETAKPIIPAGIVGAALGALVAAFLDGALLQKIFGAFLLFAGVMQWKET